MSERLTRRAGGVTRFLQQPADPDDLASIDASTFTHPQLVRALLDRGLSTTGSDAELAARLTADVTDDYGS